MGGQLSKSPSPLAAAAGGGGNGGIAATTNATTGSCNNSIEYVSELSSYEAVCLQDPELQSFDTTLQQRTSHVISTLIAGVDVHSLSFDTLREVTGCPLDTNREVVKILLEYKKDTWKNPELFDRVEEYFESSLQTLDFCTSLEKCLKKARDSQLIIIVAMKRFKEEDHSEEEKQNNGKAGKKKYEKTLEELRHFKAVGHPFTEEFFQAFQSVYRQQVSMLEKLQKKKRKLDKKLKTMKAWRKISTIIFVFAVVLICSVVTAAMNAPAVIAALAAFAASAMGPVGKWLNSLWKGYLDALKGQQEVLYNMQVRTYVRVSDLDSIRVLVDQLEVQISSLLQNVEFALREEDAVKFVIEEIKKKLEVFMRSAEELGKQADQCSRDIRRAGTVVLQRIIRHPNSIGGGS